MSFVLTQPFTRFMTIDCRKVLAVRAFTAFLGFWGLVAFSTSPHTLAVTWAAAIKAPRIEFFP